MTDPSILATKTSSTALVVSWGKTRADELKRAVQSLRNVGAMPLGVIANKLTSKSGGYYYQSYYYYGSGDTSSGNEHRSSGHLSKEEPAARALDGRAAPT